MYWAGWAVCMDGLGRMGGFRAYLPNVHCGCVTCACVMVVPGASLRAPVSPVAHIMLCAAVPPGRYRGRGATPPQLGATCGDESYTTQRA